ncbi:MAG: hypothetical protein J5666_05180 [Bacilli bacterium]|nr:hypothetical protein [Bacilli bacterium]
MYASGGYLFRRRLILIICLINQLLALLFEFLPLPGMLWVFGLILEIWTGILYLVYFFFFLGYSNDLCNHLLLLYIPIFFYSMVTIGSTWDTLYIIVAAISIIINTTLSIITLIKTKKGMIVNTNQRFKNRLIITMIMGFFMTALWFIISSNNRSPFVELVNEFSARFIIIQYLALLIYGALLILFVVLAILSIKEYRKEEKNL